MSKSIMGPELTSLPDGWSVLPTHPTLLDDESYPMILATNGAFAEEMNQFIVDGQLTKAVIPGGTIQALGRGDCLIVVSMPTPSMHADALNPNYDTRPVTLAKGETADTWENRPRPGLFRIRLMRMISGRYVIIEAFFGTDVPPTKLLDQAQQVLDSLDPEPDACILVGWRSRPSSESLLQGSVRPSSIAWASES